jgi:osmotically-inducible protein OsmY
MNSVKLGESREAAASVQTAVVKNDVGALAESCIRRDGRLATQSVSCSYHEGVLILHGIVPTYYLKQVAQTTAMGIDGVEQVDNRIEVRQSPITREVTGHDPQSEFAGGPAPAPAPLMRDPSCREAERC